MRSRKCSDVQCISGKTKENKKVTQVLSTPFNFSSTFHDEFGRGSAAYQSAMLLLYNVGKNKKLSHVNMGPGL